MKKMLQLGFYHGSGLVVVVVVVLPHLPHFFSLDLSLTYYIVLAASGEKVSSESLAPCTYILTNHLEQVGWLLLLLLVLSSCFFAQQVVAWLPACLAAAA